MRHQVYVALPAEHPLAKKGTKVIGIHHQWLYGHTAAKQLARLLTFIKKGGTALSHPFLSGFDVPIDVLTAIYTSIPEEGYYSRIIPLDADEDAAVCKNPLLADNNEGITVVDLRSFSLKDGKRKGKIAYAFVSINGHNGLPVNTPLSARQYVNAYYDAVPLDRASSSLKTTNDTGKTVRNEAEARVREVEALKVSVLTQEALTEIFPTLQAPARSSLLLLDLGDDDVAV